jgi:hypothetical protein
LVALTPSCFWKGPTFACRDFQVSRSFGSGNAVFIVASNRATAPAKSSFASNSTNCLPALVTSTGADSTVNGAWKATTIETLAKAGPFGGPIAHGYLTLSLGPVLYPEVVQIRGFSMGVNYGANKVRFPAPVPVGAKLRLGVKLLAVDEIAGGIQVTLEFTFEVEGASKPSCVAEIIFRQYV